MNLSSKKTTSEQSRRFSGTLIHWSCWERSLLIFLAIQHSAVFGWYSSCNLRVVQDCRWKRSIYTWPEDSIQPHLMIFPEELNIVQVWWRKIAKIHIVPSNTGLNVVLHFTCALLVVNDWHSDQMIVRKVLSPGKQQVSNWQKKILGAHCHFLDETF